jgi:4'-phosphopantetheinyl transferase
MRQSFDELSLQPGEVQVWLLDAAVLGRMAHDASAVLPSHEPAEAPHYADPAMLRAWLGRRTALRRLLAGYMGLAPKDLRLTREPGQKPRLSDGQRGPCFSVSYSGGWMAAAFSHVELGVDLEQVRMNIEWEALAAQFFTPQELDQVWGRPTEDRQRQAFFQIWTRKEAQLKLRGLGLGSLAALRQPLGLGGPWVEDLDLVLPSGLCGCLSLERAPLSLRVAIWPGAKAREAGSDEREKVTMGASASVKGGGPPTCP